MKKNPIRMPRKNVFEDILYANCWEDPQMDRRAFQIGPDDVVFSITSGGCNVLAFLLDDPQKIIALDINPHQNHLLDLKMAALKALEYPALLKFLGVEACEDRLSLYLRVRKCLKPESRAYWDGQSGKIKMGVIHCGRYERYMRILRRGLVLLEGRPVLERPFHLTTREERHRFYNEKWDTPAWRLFSRLLLSRTVMTLLFDPAFFAQLEETFSFGDHFRSLVERALVSLPLKTNYFMAYILLGRYPDRSCLPVYLKEENHEIIRSRLERICMIYDDCGAYFRSLPENAISRFNFTNIFEWMPPDAVEHLLRETVRVARNGSILTYRNLLVPRSRPESLHSVIRPRTRLSKMLHRQDLSFIYQSYVVEQIDKEGMSCRTKSKPCRIATA
jgi:S-adenosylmethionine-diacylglycerol 3-amino-3-carboxypropyl transferase